MTLKIVDNSGGSVPYTYVASSDDLQWHYKQVYYPGTVYQFYDSNAHYERWDSSGGFTNAKPNERLSRAPNRPLSAAAPWTPPPANTPTQKRCSAWWGRARLCWSP